MRSDALTGGGGGVTTLSVSGIYNVEWWGDWWIGKQRKRPWLTRRNISTSVWGNWEKVRKILVRIADVPANIWTEHFKHLKNTCLYRYLYTNMFGDPSYHHSTLGASTATERSASKRYWPLALPVVWLICELCSTITMFLATTESFADWNWNWNLTTLLHSSAGVRCCYVACRRGQGSLNFGSLQLKTILNV
jgi:hypothetical protein